MSHGHGHGLSATGASSASGRYVGRLGIAFGLGLTIMLLELVVGLLTHSLALLSDAAHLLTDVLGIGLSLAAILLARRSRSSGARTFGMYRADVLAALANAVLLFGVALYVLVMAIRRIADPPVVPGLPVVLVATVGVAANLVAFLLLKEGAQESLNIRGAYLEVLSDLIGSVGVLISGAVTLLFGWRYADPIIGVAIGLFVLPRTWVLARRALRILFQHAPDGLDVESVRSDLAAVDGVTEVHDLHIWTLTSGMEVISAHLITRAAADPATVLGAAQRMLIDVYHIDHATLQIEPGASSASCSELTW